jgi:ribose transport system ATP-binding protein
MAGLVGAGRTELAEAVFGVRPLTAGRVLLDGEPLRVSHPRDAIAAGVFLVPEDRRLHGLVLPEGVGFNLSLPNLDRLGSWLGVRRPAEAALHRTWIDRLRVRTPSADQPAGLLSGGNQQKVVYGKWLARGPRVLILDEPTRGVDVGAKAEIYALIDELAGRGVAVWMVTSDMEELLGMADRVVVMHEGRVAGELARDRLTEEAVMRLATGG